MSIKEPSRFYLARQQKLKILEMKEKIQSFQLGPWLWSTKMKKKSRVKKIISSPGSMEETVSSNQLFLKNGDVTIKQILTNIDKRKEDMIFKIFMVEKIFNMNETGLFYRAVLSRTYWTSDEDRKTVRGTKALKASSYFVLFVHPTCMVFDCKYIHFQVILICRNFLIFIMDLQGSFSNDLSSIVPNIHSLL